MTEHHSQEALISQAYPHCRQAALCSKDAIFGKWCNSCKGSPRTFHLRAQAILKRVTRYLITLHCHLPILSTSTSPTEVTLLKVVSSKKESDFTHEQVHIYIHQQIHLPCVWQESYTTLYRDSLTSWFSIGIQSSLVSLLNFCEDFENLTKLI